MAADLPRRIPAKPRFKRWRGRRIAWRRRPRAPLASQDAWREGHDRRSATHRYHAGLRRWPRRTLLGAVALVVVAILLAIATVAYSFWRYHELNRIAVPNLSAVKAGSPFDVLIVGTTPLGGADSSHRRGGQSIASVILLARVDPKAHSLRLVAVPPAMEVPVPVGGSAPATRPIADALESGPGTLVETVASDLHVPITDYLALKVSGIGSVVGALGGIHLAFAFPVRDAFTGLSIDNTGCRLVSGSQAQALFQSRHLYYFAEGAWRADLRGASSVIAREAAVFASTVKSSGGILFDPVELNNLVSSIVANLTIDNKISERRLLSLADMFRGFSLGQLSEETLPTVEATLPSVHGRVTAPAIRADDEVIARFLSLGTTSPVSSLLRTVHVALAPGLSVGVDARFSNSTAHLSWNPTPC
jgi:LytR_cpsA_psr family